MGSNIQQWMMANKRTSPTYAFNIEGRLSTWRLPLAEGSCHSASN